MNYYQWIKLADLVNSLKPVEEKPALGMTHQERNMIADLLARNPDAHLKKLDDMYEAKKAKGSNDLDCRNTVFGDIRASKTEFWKNINIEAIEDKKFWERVAQELQKVEEDRAGRKFHEIKILKDISEAHLEAHAKALSADRASSRSKKLAQPCIPGLDTWVLWDCRTKDRKRMRPEVSGFYKFSRDPRIPFHSFTAFYSKQKNAFYSILDDNMVSRPQIQELKVDGYWTRIKEEGCANTELIKVLNELKEWAYEVAIDCQKEYRVIRATKLHDELDRLIKLYEETK